MNTDQTLRQMCVELGVSRRAVQGYEKAALVIPSGKNKYGHLLYGESERERIRLIWFYQQMGFSLKQIKNLLDAPDFVKKSVLQVQVEKMEAEHNRLMELIQQAKEHIATL